MNTKGLCQDMTQEDYIELQREMYRRGIAGSLTWPIPVGDCMLVRTVTHYAVGRIKEIGPDYFWLEEASSVPHEGRRHVSLEKGFTTGVDRGPETHAPEVEPVPGDGFFGVMRAAIVDFVPWPHPLPNQAQ